MEWKKGSKRTTPTSSATSSATSSDNDDDNDDENKVGTRKSGRAVKPVEKLVVSETLAKRSSKSKSKGKGRRVVVDSEEEGDEAVDPSPSVSPIEEGSMSQNLDATSLIQHFDRKISLIDTDDDSDDDHSAIREWRSVAKKNKNDTSFSYLLLYIFYSKKYLNLHMNIFPGGVIEADILEKHEVPKNFTIMYADFPFSKQQRY